MNKKTIKNLFIAVIIWLPIQYAAVGVLGFYHSEPWPAFVFPGFKSVYVYDDGFEMNRRLIEITASDSLKETLTKTPADFFPEIPVSQVSGFMRSNFSDSDLPETMSDEGLSWMKQQAEKISGQEVRRLKIIHVKEFWNNQNGEMQLDSSYVTKTIQFNFEGISGEE